MQDVWNTFLFDSSALASTISYWDLVHRSMNTFVKSCTSKSKETDVL